MSNPLFAEYLVRIMEMFGLDRDEKIYKILTQDKNLGGIKNAKNTN